MAEAAERRPLVVRPGEGEKLPSVGLLRLSSADTGGAFEAIQLHMEGPFGPPPHVHNEHDEFFVILEGTLRFVLGDERVDAPPGAIVMVPSGWRHAFRSAGTAEALVITIPAGLEGFFKELGAGMAQGRPDQELRAELAGKYDAHPA